MALKAALRRAGHGADPLTPTATLRWSDVLVQGYTKQAVAHGEMVGKAVRSFDGAPERMKLRTRMSLLVLSISEVVAPTSLGI
jgi:hypothetical protein